MLTEPKDISKIRLKFKDNGRSRSSRSCIVINDIHDGASTAICSTEPVIQENGNTCKPNKLQKTLYEFWVECQDKLKNGIPKYCIVNGEPINGGNGKSRGRDNWTTNIFDQIEDFKKLLKFVKYRKILYTRGSDYHVTIDGGSTPAEEFIAKETKAIPYYNFLGQERYSNYFLDLQIHNKFLNFTHHIAGSRWSSYRPMSLAREMMNLSLEGGRLFPESEKPNFIVRAHTHSYVHIAYKHSAGWVNGAWKYPDGFLYKGGLAGTTPDVGMLEIIIESNGEYKYKFHTIPEKRINRKLFK